MQVDFVIFKVVFCYVIKYLEIDSLLFYFTIYTTDVFHRLKLLILKVHLIFPNVS